MEILNGENSFVLTRRYFDRALSDLRCAFQYHQNWLSTQVEKAASDIQSEEVGLAVASLMLNHVSQVKQVLYEKAVELAHSIYHAINTEENQRLPISSETDLNAHFNFDNSHSALHKGLDFQGFNFLEQENKILAEKRNLEWYNSPSNRNVKSPGISLSQRSTSAAPKLISRVNLHMTSATDIQHRETCRVVDSSLFATDTRVRDTEDAKTCQIDANQQNTEKDRCGDVIQNQIVAGGIGDIQVDKVISRSILIPNINEICIFSRIKGDIFVNGLQFESKSGQGDLQEKGRLTLKLGGTLTPKCHYSDEIILRSSQLVNFVRYSAGSSIFFFKNSSIAVSQGDCTTKTTLLKAQWSSHYKLHDSSTFLSSSKGYCLAENLVCFVSLDLKIVYIDLMQVSKAQKNQLARTNAVIISETPAVDLYYRNKGVYSLSYDGHATRYSTKHQKFNAEHTNDLNNYIAIKSSPASFTTIVATKKETIACAFNIQEGRCLFFILSESLEYKTTLSLEGQTNHIHTIKYINKPQYSLFAALAADCSLHLLSCNRQRASILMSNFRPGSINAEARGLCVVDEEILVLYGRSAVFSVYLPTTRQISMQGL